MNIIKKRLVKIAKFQDTITFEGKEYEVSPREGMEDSLVFIDVETGEKLSDVVVAETYSDDGNIHYYEDVSESGIMKSLIPYLQQYGEVEMLDDYNAQVDCTDFNNK